MRTYLTKKSEGKTLQMAAAHSTKNNGVALEDNRSSSIILQKKNNTGLPDNLKSGIENLSGHSMDDVKVHYNSSKPAQLNAHAYAQGTNIHLASGQEKHLPHEAWHVIQQKQGRVKPTIQTKGVAINDDKSLEKEADVMGSKALQMKEKSTIQFKKKKGIKWGKKQSLQEFLGDEHNLPHDQEPELMPELEQNEAPEPVSKEDHYDEYAEPEPRSRRRSKKHKGGVERYDMIKHVGKGRVPRDGNKIDIQTISKAEALRLKKAEQRDIRLTDHRLPSTEGGHGQGKLNDHIKLAPSIVSVAHSQTGKKHHIGIGKSKDRNPATLSISKEHRKGIDRVEKNQINKIVDENWETTRCGEHEAMSSMSKHRCRTLKGFKGKKIVPFSQVRMTATRVNKLSTTPPCARCGDVFSETQASPPAVKDLYNEKLTEKQRKSGYQKGVSLTETDTGKLHRVGKIKRKEKRNKERAKSKRAERFLHLEKEESSDPKDSKQE